MSGLSLLNIFLVILEKISVSQVVRHVARYMHYICQWVRPAILNLFHLMALVN